MKKLGEFILNEFENGKTISLVNEYRTAGSKNKSTLANVDMDKIDGKDADRNGTGGKLGSNEPINKKIDADVKSIDKTQLSRNKKRLLAKFKAEDDFFIIGRAGWGKTSIIRDFADKFGYEVKTFYLDKCEASDLGGQPIPVKNKRDEVQIEQGIPPFAKEIDENPDKKFLLFFDEMNQAAPDVMNALMPIVLEHEIAGKKYDNFFCGAAGNFESENGAVNELSAPLRSRFKPLIEWETHTEEAWADVFRHLHSKWDDKITKTLVDAFEKNATAFDNPREIEQKIFEKYIYKFIQNEDNLDVDEWLDHLQRIANDDLSRSAEAGLEKLAEQIFNVVKNGGKEPENEAGRSKRGGKDINMISDKLKDAIKHGMKYGYIEQEDENGKTVKYGISRENISTIEETEINGEQMERLINKFEADGIKFKYETDKGWKDAGYKDPNED